MLYTMHQNGFISIMMHMFNIITRSRVRNYIIYNSSNNAPSHPRGGIIGGIIYYIIPPIMPPLPGIEGGRAALLEELYII
jgi:hypothetical protein